MGAWIVLMACATLGVIATWIALATDPQTPRLVIAILATAVIGVPTAREWRHANGVLAPRP
jgi:hypothetical protein